MKEYKVNGSVIEMVLESGKVVKCSTEWANRAMKSLGTDMEDVLLMWLEDNDYLVNEEQEELDKQAKGQVKILNKSEKPKAKTPRERTQKPQPEKEFLITLLAKALEIEDISNLNIENKAKLITFDYKGASYKLDLVQKRPPKAKTE